MSAWQEGYQAHFNGGDNPYAPIDPRYLEWQSGCTAGKNGEAEMQIRVFQEGYDAYYNGQAQNMNPYVTTDPRWDEWDNGWLMAKDEEEAIADLEGYAVEYEYD